MKDRVFTGQDVEEALAQAAASLGLPLRDLRYVVLDAGSAPGRGLKPTPARIAILLHDPAAGRTGGPGGRGARAADPPEVRERPEPAPGSAGPRAVPEPPDAASGVRAIVRAVAEAGGLEIDAEIEDGEETLLVRLVGKDASFFHGDSAHGDVLYALEHLLQRTFGEALRPRVLRLRCEGFREARDAALAEEARLLADEVKESGRALQMEPLNAYDRRIVHLTLQERTDVRTYSVGEGRDRRVTIAPAGSGAAAGGDEDGR